MRVFFSGFRKLHHKLYYPDKDYATLNLKGMMEVELVKLMPYETYVKPTLKQKIMSK